MGIFDDYDFLGGLTDLAVGPFKAADNLLFGPPGEVGGILGTPINAVLDNPVEAITAVASVTAIGSILTGNPLFGGLTAAMPSLGGAALGSSTVTAKVVSGLLSSQRSRSFSDAFVCVLTERKGISNRQALAYLSGGFVLSGVTDHIIDNYVRSNVEPVPGSVVYCDLACTVEHSGIYVGDGKIAHLNGDGAVELVTRDVFMARLGGLNPALSVYVSCAGAEAVGDDLVAHRALVMAGTSREYNVVLDNCHQFTSGCLTGSFENPDNFWWCLKMTAENELRADTWRVWKK